MQVLHLKDEYIKLGQALKAAGLVTSGLSLFLLFQLKFPHS